MIGALEFFSLHFIEKFVVHTSSCTVWLVIVVKHSVVIYVNDTFLCIFFLILALSNKELEEIERKRLEALAKRELKRKQGSNTCKLMHSVVSALINSCSTEYPLSITSDISTMLYIRIICLWNLARSVHCYVLLVWAVSYLMEFVPVSTHSNLR